MLTSQNFLPSWVCISWQVGLWSKLTWFRGGVKSKCPTVVSIRAEAWTSSKDPNQFHISKHLADFLVVWNKLLHRGSGEGTPTVDADADLGKLGGGQIPPVSHTCHGQKGKRSRRQPKSHSANGQSLVRLRIGLKRPFWCNTKLGLLASGCSRALFSAYVSKSSVWERFCLIIN